MSALDILVLEARKKMNDNSQVPAPVIIVPVLAWIKKNVTIGLQMLSHCTDGCKFWEVFTPDFTEKFMGSPEKSHSRQLG